MSWRLSLFVVFVCGLMLPGGASLANGGQLQVIASHGILADVARVIAGDHAEVSSLIPVGADPHAFMPTPSDLTTVAKAELVIINGAGYEEALLDAVENAGEGGNIVNASACVGIRPFGVGMGHGDHEDDHADDDHGDEHAEGDQDDAHADDEDHADDDDHGDEHADDEDHADDDDHGDENADDEDHADDDGDHGDVHADDEDHADDDDDHADEHDDDEDADHEEGDHDDEHADDHDDGMAGNNDCDDHDAEFAAIVGEGEDDHAHVEVLGRGMEVDCLGAHEHGGEDAHGEGACDPHLWMDPHNVIYWALMIRDTLSTLDHDNEDAYAANAAAYAGELAALEADFILPALDELPDDKRVLITSHETLGYFATTFGFEIITTVVPGMSTMVEPSARDVAAMIDLVRDEGVPAIFSDAHLSDVLVQTIAGETGVEVVGLYSDALSDPDGPAATYLDYMRYNVATIVEALKGDWR